MSSKSKNPTRTVILNADRPRTLKLSHKAMKLIVKITGKNIDELEGFGGNFELIEQVAWALMQRDAAKHGETLTLEQMEDILDEVESYQEIIDAISDAFEAAFPSNDAVKNAQAAVTQDTTPEA